MNQFSDAIESGVRSATEAETNVGEIRTSLNELAQAVEQFTSGKVTVAFSKIPATSHEAGLNGPAKAIANALAMASLGVQKTVDVISLRRTTSPHNAVTLARLDIPSYGYPCVVHVDDMKYSCNDQQSFVKILKDIISGPDAGKALIRLQKEQV